MELLCPVCHSADIWTIPEQDGFGRCHRCYVVLVWSFVWWRLLSESEFFAKHCVISERLGQNVVRLARSNEQDKLGRYLSDVDSWNIDAPCSFLKDDGAPCRCALQDAKPAECRVSKCWKPASKALPIRWSDAELHALGWDGWTGEFAEEYKE